MGPPPVGGGRGPQRTQGVARCCGFNGAAPRRGRKDEPLEHQNQLPRPHPASMGPPPVGGGRPSAAVHHRCARFRASMGPPPVGGGRTEYGAPIETQDGALQWGRPPSGAEGHGLLLPRFSARVLQWGRPPSGAEGSWSLTRWQDGARLSASMGPPPVGGGRPAENGREARVKGFNGAAPRRGRKGRPRHARGRRRFWVLQWGRPPSGAEGEHRGDDLPRPWSRRIA